jgi:hypothetical protein
LSSNPIIISGKSSLQFPGKEFLFVLQNDCDEIIF